MTIKQITGKSRTASNKYINFGATTLIVVEKKGENYYSLIDTADVELAKTGKWHIHSEDYLCNWDFNGERGNTVFLHQLIAGGKGVDHINRIRRDNHRSNIRLATPSQNNQNQGPRGGSSKYIGVDREECNRKWRSRLKVSGKNRHIGYFDNETAFILRTASSFVVAIAQ